MNRAMVQVLNLCLSFVFVIFAYLSLAHGTELLGARPGRSLLLPIAVFWYPRAAEQVIFFGLRRSVSVALLVLFLPGGSLYMVPLL